MDDTLARKVYRGMINYLVIASYLWVVLGLFVLYSWVALFEHHIPFAPEGFALVNALALAKVILIARHLHFGARYDKAPLVYTIFLKSGAFAILLGCFRLFEEALIGSFHGRSLSAGISAINGVALTRTAVLTAILAVALVPFFAFIELASLLGEEKIKRLLFAPRGATLPIRLG